MIDSGFDYFAGGGLLQPTGKEKDKEDLYALAEAAGYKVVQTQAEAEALKGRGRQSFAIDGTLQTAAPCLMKWKEPRGMGVDRQLGEEHRGVDNDNGFL